VPDLVLVLLAIALFTIVLGAVGVVRAGERDGHEARWRERRLAARERRVTELYDAARTGGIEFDRALNGGADLDTRDRKGDTALHRAYYLGADAAVALLLRYGADENLVNREGLLPAEMAEVARIEDELERMLDHLADDGSWRDPDRARPAYQRLSRLPRRLYNPALVRFALRCTHHRRLLALAIRLGVPGSERKLATVLDAYGTKEMAEDYLACGSATLHGAAARWAARNGYALVVRYHGPTVTWGRF
jgi:hypothetical protein